MLNCCSYICFYSLLQKIIGKITYSRNHVMIASYKILINVIALDF